MAFMASHTEVTGDPIEVKKNMGSTDKINIRIVAPGWKSQMLENIALRQKFRDFQRRLLFFF